MDLELIAEGLDFPEGPVVMADGSVILVEVRGERLTRVHPDGRKDVLAGTAIGPNGAAIGPDGAVWIATNGGAFSYREQDGLIIPEPTRLAMSAARSSASISPRGRSRQSGRNATVKS